MSLFTDKAPPIMVTLMADFGLSKLDAAAILGNIGHECGGFLLFQEQKPMVAGSAGGFGWCQWTGPRRREFEAYCARNSLDPKSDRANYGFLFVELKGSEKGALAPLRKASTLRAKVMAFEAHFERAGVKHYDSRAAYADQALAAYEALERAGKLVPLFPVDAAVKPASGDASPWLTIARSYIGQKEIAGSKDNPTIAGFYKRVTGRTEHDEVAWCAAFVGSCLVEAGYPSTGALNARSYLTYGTKLDEPIPGCIVVYSRGDPKGWQGHVQFFTRKVGSRIYGIGGNQQNAVGEDDYSDDQLLGYRWPPGAPLGEAAPAVMLPQPDDPGVDPADPAPTGFWAWFLAWWRGEL